MDFSIICFKTFYGKSICYICYNFFPFNNITTWIFIRTYN